MFDLVIVAVVFVFWPCCKFQVSAWIILGNMFFYKKLIKTF